MKRFGLILGCLVLVAGVTWAQHGRGGHGHDRGRGHHRTEYRCATPEQMHMVMRVLDNQSFDDKRLEVAQLCVVLGEFCVDDLARMASKFSFDDNRLQFLQYAYPYCVDPENYYYLRGCFSFESNFEKLMETIPPRRR